MKKKYKHIYYTGLDRDGKTFVSFKFYFKRILYGNYNMLIDDTDKFRKLRILASRKHSLIEALKSVNKITEIEIETTN